MRISGTTILLTGATGGLGHAIARELHRAGGDLVLTGRRTEVLEPLAAELGARSLAVDLSELGAVERLALECGEVQILVANAGLPAAGPVMEYEPNQIARALTVNLHAPILLARLLGERMVAAGTGHIVFMSSLAGKAAAPGAALYSATKFGLRGFAQGLREDLRGAGVGVSTIFPWFVRDAGMYADARVTTPRAVGTCSPEEVARAVVRVIESNKGEVDVGPLTMRLAVTTAELNPELARYARSRLGIDRLWQSVGDRQVDKR